MKLGDLLEHFSQALAQERDRASTTGFDAPVIVSRGRRHSSAGELFLYSFELPADAQPTTLSLEDVPVTVIPPGNAEPTEGFIIAHSERTIFVQTFDAIGQAVDSATIVPDTTAFLDAVSRRLADMSMNPEAYALGPAERLLLWLDPESGAAAARAAVSPSVFGTVWSDDLADRRAKLAAQAVGLVRANKRLLLISPAHRAADESLGILARALRVGGLAFKSLISRYEIALQPEAAGMVLPDLGFEAQLHQFYARSRTDKATLRRKYERFRELTPLLAYKAEKQRDLDEVKLLEWRLITQCAELQDKIKEIDTTLAEYEAIPIWKRLAMQTVGKNVGTLADYRTIYEQNIQKLKGELEVAKQRIDELSPEAAIPKDLRPEYQELKEEITRLGGTKKIRELLAAEEGTNRQAFIQNKRVVVTTAARVASDPLFKRVRFDVLLADEAPFIPAPFLMAAAGVVREKIILSGDTRDLTTAEVWASPWGRVKKDLQSSAVSSQHKTNN
jgi:chaperonin cofactor prefoldin